MAFGFKAGYLKFYSSLHKRIHFYVSFLPLNQLNPNTAQQFIGMIVDILLNLINFCRHV